MLENLSNDEPLLNRAGLGELRPYVPALVAALAEVPVVGIPAKVLNEGRKELAAERSEQEQREWFDRLLSVGEQTNEEISTLTMIAAAIFAQQQLLLARLHEAGSDVEGARLNEFAKAAALVAYRSRVARDYQYADHRGIEGVTRAAHVASLELDDVYVIPRLAAERERAPVHERERELLRKLTRDRDCTAEERIRMEEEYAILTGERWGGKKEAEQGAPFGAALKDERHAVVIGSPGVGKSALSRYVARVCALGGEVVRERLGWDDAPVPVVVPLASFAEARRTNPALRLRAFLDERMQERGGEALRETMGEILARGGALVVLDGVDEVPESHARAAVVQAVDEFVADHAASRVVVTSRPYGYVPLKGDIAHFQLPNFTAEQVEEFVHKWQRACEMKEHPKAPNFASAEADAESLLQEIRRNPKVTELATNPLMLVIVSLVRYEKARLPEERVQLYNKAVNTLMDTWNQWRSQAGRDVGGVTLPLDRLVRVWGAIAEWTRRTKNTGIMHRAELKRELVRLLVEREFDEEDPEATAESYLRAAADRAGLLEERGTDVFAFWHPTFEEFLAAVELATPTKSAAARLLPLADDPRWREVILLAVGYVGIIQRDTDTATEIVESLLRDNLPVHEPITHARLRLAAACIADDVGIKRTVAQRVIFQLADAVQRFPYAPLISAFSQTVRALPRLRPNAATVLGLESLFAHPSWEVRIEAARLVANAAASDPNALRMCRAALEDDDPDVSCHGALGLVRAGVYGIEVWVSLSGFQSHFAQVEGSVKEALANLPPAGLTDLTQALAIALEDTTRPSLLPLALALKPTEAFRSMMVLLLRAENVWLRLEVAELLRESGDASDAVVSAVVPLLEAEDQFLALRAVNLLWELGHSSAELVSTVVRLLEAEDQWVRLQAADLLRPSGLSSELVVSAMVPLLEAQDQSLRLQAANLLWEHGHSSEVLKRAAEPLLEAVDKSLHLQAVNLLRELGLPSDALISAAVPLLEAEDHWVKLQAVTVLRELGHSSDALVSAAVPLLQAEDQSVRLRAVHLLRELGHSSEVLVNAVMQLLQAGDQWMRVEAVDLLQELGQSSQAVVSAVAPMLEAEDQWVKLQAVNMLRELGHPPEALLTVVGWLVEKGDQWVRLNSVNLLRELGQPSAELVSAVVRLLEAEDQWVRLQAADLLRQIGPPEVLDRVLQILGAEAESDAVRGILQRASRRYEDVDRASNVVVAHEADTEPQKMLRNVLFGWLIEHLEVSAAEE